MPLSPTVRAPLRVVLAVDDSADVDDLFRFDTQALARDRLDMPGTVLSVRRLSGRSRRPRARLRAFNDGCDSASGAPGHLAVFDGPFAAAALDRTSVDVASLDGNARTLSSPARMMDTEYPG